MYSYYLDLSRDDELRFSRTGRLVVPPPDWFKEGEQPCQCEAKPETLHTHQGAHDFIYLQLQCPICNHTWSDCLT